MNHSLLLITVFSAMILGVSGFLLAASFDTKCVIEIDGIKWKFTYADGTSYGEFIFQNRADILEVFMIEKVGDRETTRERAIVERLGKDIMLMRFNRDQDVPIVLERQEIYL